MLGHSRWLPLITGLVIASALAVGAATLAAGAAPLSQGAAARGSLSVAYPTDGAVVTTTDIPVRVTVSNFTIACDEAGAPNRDGVGHIHIMLDGMTMAQLTNFYCSQQFTLSGQGLQPGQHTLIADLSNNAHLDLMDTAQTITFLYQPSTAPAGLPQPGPATGASVRIAEPTDGATVGPKFNLGVQASNFTASCDLEGKRNVTGHGHYHVFVDQDPVQMMQMMMGGDHQMMGDHMDMMEMPGMISMPCANSIPVNLSAWPSGPHTIAVELEQNDHTPLMEAGQGPKFQLIQINLQNPFHP
jgi:hypothetical protein